MYGHVCLARLVRRGELEVDRDAVALESLNP